MNKILSVSIAAYNVEEYIRETLESFMPVIDDERLEVLIINDGSSDSTKTICEEFERRYPSIFRVITKENGGWGSTLNRGINEAQGKYFKELDGDDYFVGKNLSDFIDYLQYCNADLVYTPYLEFDSKSGKVLHKRFYDNDEIKNDIIIKFDDVANQLPFTMHSCTFRTELLKNNNVKVLEKCFYTDKEFILRSSMYTKTIVFLDLDIYCYRVSRDGQSMSSQGLAKHYNDLIRTTKVYLSLIESEKLSNNVKNLFFNQIKNTIKMTYLAFYCMGATKENKEKLRSYDKWLKNEYPNFYKIDFMTVNLDRIFGFSLFPIIVNFRKLIKN